MKKRVSWCLEVGCQHLYYDRRTQAVERAREEKQKGHPLWMTRCQLSGDTYTETPVDLDTLIVEAEQHEQEQEARIQEALNTPSSPMPQRVLQQIMRALL